jgi:transcriptional regulator with PAS, ATPase and Fis domain
MSVMLVSEIMVPTEVRIRPGESIRRAIELLKSAKFNGVPVVDEAGKLIGYFGRSNLFDCLLQDLSLDAPIDGHYISEVVYLREDKAYDSLSELSLWLSSSRVGQTIVVNMDDEPIGMLTQAGSVIDLLNRTEYLYNELSTVLENVQAGILTTSDNGMVTLANQYAKDILQEVQTGDYIGDHFTELKDDFSAIIRGDWIAPRKIDHQTLKLIVTGVPIYQNTQVRGVIFVIQDLTDVEGIAHELGSVKKLKTTLETVLEVAYEGVAVLDEQNLITLANVRFCDKIGRTRDAVIGRNISTFIPLINNDIPLQVLEIDNKPCVISTLPMPKEDGARGFVIKIYEDLDQLTDVMQQLNRLNMQLDYYKNELYKANGTSYTLSSIVCKTEVVNKIKAQILQVSRSNSTVLLIGESGTGKELFAHSIHNASNRRKEPFVKVNCSAIPSELAEAELFGYEEGAFTGARKQGKPGKFELADGGTIFLDEIGDMPLQLQGKLLRVIQEKEVERVGDTRTRKVDVRIIAATNKDLKRLVSHGDFREDLYFRLDVIEFKIPPLRERKADIQVLAEHFIRKYNSSFSKQVTGISDQGLAALEQYHWPGNIRELENIIERILNYVDRDLIELQDIPEEIRAPRLQVSTSGQSLEMIEQEAIRAALAEAQGNKSKAARLLGISRSKLYEKLSRLG